MSLLPSIYAVTCHTDNVGQGSIFVAIPGLRLHGAAFVAEAIRRGAKEIILQRGSACEYDALCQQDLAAGVVYRFVRCARTALARYAALVYGMPARTLKIIGVTGTKGKTTTSHLIAHFLRAAGKRVALIGTVKNCIGDLCEPSSLTTPNSDYIQLFLSLCRKQGVEYVVMEVSAHALTLQRVHGLLFEDVVFTNLSEDHLDFYNDITDYFAAKKRLVVLVKDCGRAHALDSERGRQFCASGLQHETRLICKGIWKKDVQYRYSVFTHGMQGIAVTLHDGASDSSYQLSSALVGESNAENIVLACSVARAQGVPWETLKSACISFEGVAGRINQYALIQGATAVVDYAHEPFSMERLLSFLRAQTNELWVVFGCGGQRDRLRRSRMGSVATQYADYIVVTNDNPRTEDPESIIKDITAGITQYNSSAYVVTIQDREQAIAHACQSAGKEAIVAILGRGHEQYQVIGSQKKCFADKEIVQRYSVE